MQLFRSTMPMQTKGGPMLLSRRNPDTAPPGAG